MTDKELRSLILGRLYELRLKPAPSHTERDFISLGISVEDAIRGLEQLMDYGLAKGKPIYTLGDSRGGNVFYTDAKITGFGSDVVEGEQKSPVAIEMNFFNNFSGATNIMQGSHNTMNVDASVRTIIAAIEAAPVTEGLKTEAKEALARMLGAEALRSIISPDVRATLGL